MHFLSKSWSPLFFTEFGYAESENALTNMNAISFLVKKRNSILPAVFQIGMRILLFAGDLGSV